MLIIGLKNNTFINEDIEIHKVNLIKKDLILWKIKKAYLFYL